MWIGTVYTIIILEIRKSQDLAKDLWGTASQSGEENLSIKNCELYTET